MNKELNNLNKRKMILLTSIVSLVLILLGSTYAFFSYTKSMEAFVLDSGDISALFTAGTNTVSFGNAYPISDEYATQNLDKLTYVDFTVSSNVTREDTAVEYEIYLTSDYSSLSSEYVKLYLTDDKNKKITGPILYSDLDDSTRDYDGKTLYIDSNIGLFTRSYRLYVWLDKEYTQNQVSQTFTFKVNLYARNAENNTVNYAVKQSIANSTCNPIVTDTDGTIYMSGTNDCVNFNYVWYSGKLWRITAIYPDGTMKMITDGLMTTIAYGESDDKFYTDENTTSYMYQWLNQEFLPTLYNYENIIVEDATWNASPGNETISSKLPIEGQDEVLVNASVGLLNSYEYYQSYRNTSSSGYLNIGYFWWLLNPYSASSSKVWYVYSDGSNNNSYPSSSYGARPSIYLKSTIQLIGGNGTVDNPYRIKGDKGNIEENVTLINTRQSGEYVKLVDDEIAPTFRIVGVETINGATSTKLVLNDYVRDTTDVDADSNTTEVLKKAFGTTNSWSNVSKNDPTYWRGYLNTTWIKEVDPTYNSETGTFGMLEKGTYYLGGVTSGSNYKLVVCKVANNEKSVQDCIDENTEKTPTIQASVMEYSGLPRYGEMFASQFGTGYGNSTTMWLITPYRSSSVWYVYNTGGIGSNSPSSYTFVARPSINLKSTIIIKSGSGTKKDPFIVGLS